VVGNVVKRDFLMLALCGLLGCFLHCEVAVPRLVTLAVEAMLEQRSPRPAAAAGSATEPVHAAAAAAASTTELGDTRAAAAAGTTVPGTS
jgi:hypothetical protein